MAEISEKTAKTDNKVKKEKVENFVIVDVNSSQEKVSVGDVLEVNRMKEELGEKVKFNEVLLSFNDGKTTVGKPHVANAVVEMEVVEHLRGDKIHVRKFKSKSRYRRHIGHRQDLTRLKVTNINF